LVALSDINASQGPDLYIRKLGVVLDNRGIKSYALDFCWFGSQEEFSFLFNILVLLGISLTGEEE